jgi:hypothetical protein
MYDTGLADRIRAKGVTVVEVAGWKTRGNSTSPGGTPFKPRGAIHHHTAGSANGATPSLAICIYGRSDVPGPLCQVLQSREVDPADDKAYVIAAGKANHGGVGHWNNSVTDELINSNYESEGLEVEHTGTTTASAVRHEISCRILAAMLEAPGSSHDHLMCCEHYEYADPDGRKIDFKELNPPFANRADGVRARVKHWIGRTTSEEEDDVLTPDQDKKLDAIAVAVVKHYQDAQPSDARFRVQTLVAEAVDNRFATAGSATRVQLVGEHDNDPKGLVEYALERSEKFAALEAKVDQILAILNAEEPPPTS